MDCLDFCKWLESRDIYDVSEADKALKHSTGCSSCQDKLRVDEQLDEIIYEAMQREEMPGNLRDKVDLSLARMSEVPSKTRYGLYGAFSAAVAIVFVVGFFFSYSPPIPSMEKMGRHVIADHTGHGDGILVVHDLENIGRLGDFSLTSALITSQVPESYSFVGARICPLGDCKSVHIVFLDKGRRVSLYVIKDGDVDFSLSNAQHYNMNAGEQTVNFWKKGKYVFAETG